jgi:hypothetical protein
MGTWGSAKSKTHRPMACWTISNLRTFPAVLDRIPPQSISTSSRESLQSPTALALALAPAMLALTSYHSGCFEASPVDVARDGDRLRAAVLYLQATSTWPLLQVGNLPIMLGRRLGCSWPRVLQTTRLNAYPATELVLASRKCCETSRRACELVGPFSSQSGFGE